MKLLTTMKTLLIPEIDAKQMRHYGDWQHESTDK